jgi:hypothetical protein
MLYSLNGPVSEARKMASVARQITCRLLFRLLGWMVVEFSTNNTVTGARIEVPARLLEKRNAPLEEADSTSNRQSRLAIPIGPSHENSPALKAPHVPIRASSERGLVVRSRDPKRDPTSRLVPKCQAHTSFAWQR